ncbi:cobalamin-independent methionine synthase II family protein [Methylohalobius crimeensis]|uniref:cobalamin-independent methionine synthase II family protein n=1 Tax=Methylohalobius crimeensis TaxID=244365 RepID=UPI0003B3C4A0|nr:cobalamin-independent methionine synthase II family protein [Methylohalobius crimeensis]
MPTSKPSPTLPTEPIGSVPRPPELIDAVKAFAAGRLGQRELDALIEVAVRDTVARFETTGSPVITDGEQGKPNFLGYPLEGLSNIAPDGIAIAFADGHQRRLPRLDEGPFRYARYADGYLKRAQKYARVPVKQAVISASALSLLYPEEGIADYPRERFLADLVDETATDVRRCLAQGAHRVQIDFTEGRLAVKLDPSGGLLRFFVELNNRVLARFTAEERKRIGIHTCPGGDRDSTHSADVDYAGLLPHLFELKADNFYIQLASEPDRESVLEIIAEHAKPDQRLFVGVIDPIDPRAESPETVRDRVLEAARHLPPERLGTTDDCGFSPFGDDTSTARDLAFEKIRARVEGTRLASAELNLK